MKKYISYIFAISTVILLSGCSGKEEYLDAPIKGRLVYVNTINGLPEEIPYAIKNINVFLSDNEDIANFTSYLISKKTDSLGIFTFNFTPESAKRIYCKTIINGIEYSGSIAIPSDETSKKDCKIILTPTIGKGLIVNLLDGSSNIIPNKEVYIFTTPVNVNTINISDAAYHSKTNIYGKAYFDSIPGGLTYYLYAESALNSITYKATRPIAINLNYTGRIDTTLRIIPNGLKIILKDNLGNLLPNINVCIFDNSFYSNATNCTGNIGSFTTNSLGEVFFPNLKRGVTYYYLINGVVNGSNYTKNGSVPLSSITDIQIEPVTVPAVLNSSFKLMTIDKATSSPLNNLSICVFSSFFYANWAPCSQSLQSGHTNSNGIFAASAITDAGKYYVRVTDSILTPGPPPAKIYLNGLDSFYYNPSASQKIDTIKVNR